MQPILNYVTDPVVLRNVGLFLLYIGLMVAIGHRSQIDAWCERNPRLAGTIKLVRGALPFDPWLLVQGAALILFRRMPIGYQRAATNLVPPPTDTRTPPGSNQ